MTLKITCLFKKKNIVLSHFSVLHTEIVLQHMFVENGHESTVLTHSSISLYLIWGSSV